MEGLRAKQLIIVLFGGRRVGTLFCEPYVEILLTAGGGAGWGDHAVGNTNASSKKF